MERLNDPMQAVVDWLTRPTPVLTPAEVHASAVRSRYFQNARATTRRLAGELCSQDGTVRSAAYLRLVRRLGFTTARDVWRQEKTARGVRRAGDWRFRLDCQIAAGTILAGSPDRG